MKLKDRENYITIHFSPLRPYGGYIQIQDGNIFEIIIKNENEILFLNDLDNDAFKLYFELKKGYIIHHNRKII